MNYTSFSLDLHITQFCGYTIDSFICPLSNQIYLSFCYFSLCTYNVTNHIIYIYFCLFVSIFVGCIPKLKCHHTYSFDRNGQIILLKKNPIFNMWVFFFPTCSNLSVMALLIFAFTNLIGEKL